MPLKDERTTIGFEYAKRSERCAFEFIGLQHSVRWVDVHVVAFSNVPFDLLDPFVEITFVALLCDTICRPFRASGQG